ncbi:MAG: acetyl-CoA carboxylase biotin carboxyl carrier protein [Pseudonocardiaceae bacterium]|nr:acetyl-CoA carboxylase biotin carboxyl carrier protein [Pseudonocardiaceae bacterium]
MPSSRYILLFDKGFHYIESFGRKGAIDVVSYREISEILAVIDRLDCDSLQLECDDLTLSVSRGAATPAEPAPPPPPPHPETEAAVETAAEPGGTADPPTPQHWLAVRAPMAGTFYRTPAPEEAPFVDIGSPVSAGQAVGLIEVMKLFTELKAEHDGTVVRIDATDGVLVEYDQPIVWIEPR